MGHKGSKQSCILADGTEPRCVHTSLQCEVDLRFSPQQVSSARGHSRKNLRDTGDIEIFESPAVDSCIMCSLILACLTAYIMLPYHIRPYHMTSYQVPDHIRAIAGHHISCCISHRVISNRSTHHIAVLMPCSMLPMVCDSHDANNLEDHEVLHRSRQTPPWKHWVPHRPKDPTIKDFRIGAQSRTQIGVAGRVPMYQGLGSNFGVRPDPFASCSLLGPVPTLEFRNLRLGYISLLLW